MQGYEERRSSIIKGDIEATPQRSSLQSIDAPTSTPRTSSKVVSFNSPVAETIVFNETDDDFIILKSSSKPNYISFPLLLHRSFINLLRQPKLFFTRIYQGIFFALILACFYAPVGDDQQSIQNRIGNLYELTATCFIGMLNCIDIFPTERNVFYREYVDGIYSSYAFILSYLIIAIPINAIGCFLISLLMTCAVGLKPTFLGVIEFTFPIFSFVFAGECLGVIFCSAFSHIGFSLNLVSAVISFFGKYFTQFLFLYIEISFVY